MQSLLYASHLLLPPNTCFKYYDLQINYELSKCAIFYCRAAVVPLRVKYHICLGIVRCNIY